MGRCLTGLFRNWFSTLSVVKSVPQTGSSGSAAEELSPVNPPVFSLARALSSNTIPNHFSVPSFASHNPMSSVPFYGADNSAIVREMSISPDEKVAVEDLKAALTLLGLETSPEKEVALISRLNVDTTGHVVYRGMEQQISQDILNLLLVPSIYC